MTDKPSEAIKHTEAHLDAAVASFDKAKDLLMVNPDFQEGYGRLMAAMTTLKIWTGKVHDRPFVEVHAALLANRCILNGRKFDVENVETKSTRGVNKVIVTASLADFGGDDDIPF